MSRAYRSSWERRLGRTESPIEGNFLDNFCALAIEYGYDVVVKSRAKEGAILVAPQKWIDRYRVDFLISYPFFGRMLEIVVECDGHEYHERTPKQATRDKRRDRALQSAGYKVFRFTGSEINGDPRGSAFDVLDAIMGFQTECCLELMTDNQQEAA